VPVQCDGFEGAQGFRLQVMRRSPFSSREIQNLIQQYYDFSPSNQGATYSQEYHPKTMKPNLYTYFRAIKAIRLGLSLSLITSICVGAGGVYANTTDIPTRVEYCRIVQKPESVKGVEVSVSATYRYGFEWSEMYCLGCLDSGRTWVDFDESVETTTKSALLKRLHQNEDLGRTANVVFSGVLEGPGRYGHEGAYRFKFIVKSVRDVKIILKDGRVPDQLPEEVKKRVRSSSATVGHKQPTAGCPALGL
jgi:hypothetical protein